MKVEIDLDQLVEYINHKNAGAKKAYERDGQMIEQRDILIAQLQELHKALEKWRDGGCSDKNILILALENYRRTF